MKPKAYRGLLFCSLFCLYYISLEGKPLQFSVSAESAILMNAETGAILYETNGRKLQYPASTAKIATVSYALAVRGNELNKELVADQDALATATDAEMERTNYNPAYRLIPRHTHMGIKRGEVLTLENLLYGTMLVSACDASNVIAKEIGGTIPEFMVKLNEYLRTIGCQNTTFKNPHGLHHPEQKTTAYDLATMTRVAMKNPTFCQIVKTVNYTRPETNKQKSANLVQHNKLLKRGEFYYPKAIGVKTGYFSIAKNNLVAAARSGDRFLIAVLMKTEERSDSFRDAIKMFETAFAEKKMQRILLSAGAQDGASLTLKGAAKPIKAYLKNDVVLEYYPSEEPSVRCFLEWSDVNLPIAKDQAVGLLHFKDANGALFSHPLFAQEEVSMTWRAKALQWFETHRLLALLAGAGFLAFVFLTWRFTRAG